MKVSEALKKHHTFDTLEEWECNPTWNNLSVAAKYHRIDEAKTLIKSEIAQHFVDELYFDFVKMHLLNHFCDRICQLSNLPTICSELPEEVIMDIKQAYRQSNRHDTAFQILQKKAWKGVFQYR